MRQSGSHGKQWERHGEQNTDLTRNTDDDSLLQPITLPQGGFLCANQAATESKGSGTVSAQTKREKAETI